MSQSQFQKLQRVQNTAARIVTRTCKMSHITPVLQSLHWLPLTARIEFKILVITYQCYYQTAPAYLTELVQKYIPSRTLRSCDLQQLVIPRMNLKSFGERSFSYCAPTLWNKLPRHLQQCPSLSSFKAKLKTHLFKKYYNV